MTPARPRRFALAALLTGALAAALLPGAPAGLAWLLVALALAAAAALAGAAPRTRAGLGAGAIAVALAATAVVRDAAWVVTWELVAALVLGSIAMSCPRGWRGVAHAAVAAVVRMPGGARLVAGTATRALPRASGRTVWALGRGLVLATTLLALFGALFATGDEAFAQIAQDVIPAGISLGDLPLRLLVFAIVVALAGGLVRAATVPDRSIAPPLLRLGTIEWRIALGALNLLFAAFVAVQVAVLFGGDAYVRETAGLTYAEYARSGFAQLVAVGVLTLAVVASAMRWARASTPAQARLLRAGLGLLCLLTLVVLASALDRLGLYEEAYGFSRTRLAAHAFLLFSCALFVLVLAALASGRRGWVAQATVALTAVAALAFAASDPDRRIAERNVERFESTGRIDVDYLAQLSADAVPALARLPAGLRERALAPQRRRLAAQRDGFAGANLARARARRALAR